MTRAACLWWKIDALFHGNTSKHNAISFHILCELHYGSYHNNAKRYTIFCWTYLDFEGLEDLVQCLCQSRI